MKNIFIGVGVLVVITIIVLFVFQIVYPSSWITPIPPSGVPPSAKGIVHGQVLLGPTCPVERNPPDPNCAPRPYQTSIRVQPVSPSSPYMTITTDASGTFTVSIDPGTYTLQPQSQNNSVYPRCTATEVTVVAGQTQNVNLDCDTGIR